MAQAVEQAQKQRELSKEALASDLNRLEAKVRSELDVRSRLRRDGARLIALGGAAVLVVGLIVVVRARLRGDEPSEEAAPASLDEVAAELREIRKALEKQGKGGGSLAQKALLRGLSAAGAAAGTLLARQMLARQGSGSDEGTARTSAG